MIIVANNKGTGRTINRMKSKKVMPTALYIAFNSNANIQRIISTKYSFV